jgi:choline-glycine betaine transporter
MNHGHSQGMGKHMVLMLICCLVPIALIAAVSIFGLSLGSLQPLLPYVIALMCPLMMIVMMRGMMQGKNHDHSQHHTTPSRVEPKVQPPLAASNPMTTSPISTQDSCHGGKL